MREILWDIETTNQEYDDRIREVNSALGELIDAEAKKNEVIEIPSSDDYLREKLEIEVLEIKRQAKGVISRKEGRIRCSGMLSYSVELGVREIEKQGWVCSINVNETEQEVEILIDFTQSLWEAQKRRE